MRANRVSLSAVLRTSPPDAGLPLPTLLRPPGSPAAAAATVPPLFHGDPPAASPAATTAAAAWSALPPSGRLHAAALGRVLPRLGVLRAHVGAAAVQDPRVGLARLGGRDPAQHAGPSHSQKTGKGLKFCRKKERNCFDF